MPLAAAGVGYRHVGFTFHLVGIDVLYRPFAAGSLPACPCRYGARFSGGAIWAVMGSGLPDSACCFCCTPSRQPISVAPVNYSLPASTSGWTGSYRRPQALLIFTLLGGAVVCIGTALVDLFNRFLFSAKIVFW